MAVLFIPEIRVFDFLIPEFRVSGMGIGIKSGAK